MIYQSTDTLDDVRGNLFSLFCSIWRTVLKMFVRLFRIKQVKASKKVSQELFTKKKDGVTETKRHRFLDNLRKPYLDFSSNNRPNVSEV